MTDLMRRTKRASNTAVSKYEIITLQEIHQ